MEELTLGYILRKQIWEDYWEERAEAEEEIALRQLNRLHNKKGYTLADYERNYCDLDF